MCEARLQSVSPSTFTTHIMSVVAPILVPVPAAAPAAPAAPAAAFAAPSAAPVGAKKRKFESQEPLAEPSDQAKRRRRVAPTAPRRPSRKDYQEVRWLYLVKLDHHARQLVREVTKTIQESKGYKSEDEQNLRDALNEYEYLFSEEEYTEEKVVDAIQELKMCPATCATPDALRNHPLMEFYHLGALAVAVVAASEEVEYAKKRLDY